PAIAAVNARWAGWALSILPAALFAFLVAHIPVIAQQGVLVSFHDWIPSLGIALSFRLDGFSLLFAMMITGIGTLVVIYAGSYFADKPASETGRFLTLIMIFMTAMLGTVLADDLIVMFVFWEMTSLTSFLLIGF